MLDVKKAGEASVNAPGGNKDIWFFARVFLLGSGFVAALFAL
ncbi:hypothetical protein [Phyllobacterium salinisoli]|nr:hypothetical protein [Phyllobacterium salinisoli]